MARPRKELEVNLEHTHEDVKIPVTGDLNRDELKVSDIEIHANMQNFDEKAAALAFMEEPVTIYLNEPVEATGEHSVFLAVNGEGALMGGKNPWVPRGRTHTIKRKFILNLLTARGTAFAQPYAHALEEEKANYLRPHTSMRYPFSLVEDKNPKGHAWLRELMGR